MYDTDLPRLSAMADPIPLCNKPKLSLVHPCQLPDFASCLLVFLLHINQQAVRGI